MTVVRLLRRPVCTAITMAVIATPSLLHAQTSAALPHTPELLGLYPGMPFAQARAMLQQHSSTINVTTNPNPDAGNGPGLSLMDGANRDFVEVFTTRAPNDPAVWLIRRSQNILLDHPMTKTALVSALHDKYGKETLTMDRGGGGLYLFWLFDQGGHLLASANQTLTGCSGSSFVSYMMSGPPQAPNDVEKVCFATFSGVTAMLNMKDANLLQAYSVELVNLPYAFRAAAATANAKNAAADQARKDQLQQGNKNKPVL